MANPWKTKKKDGVEYLVLDAVDSEQLDYEPASAYGADVELDSDDRVTKITFEEERLMPFSKPGVRVEAKQLYTVKAMKPDGTVIQVPLERQINNQVASPENAIGLRSYERRGFTFFFNFDTHEGAFCPTWGCWAKWDKKFDGHCSVAHQNITEPKNENQTFGGEGVTTSSRWG